MLRLVKVSIVAVILGVTIALFIIPLYVSIDRAILSNGEDVYTPNGMGKIEKVNRGRVTVKLNSGAKEVYSIKEVEERDSETATGTISSFP